MIDGTYEQFASYWDANLAVRTEPIQGQMNNPSASCAVSGDEICLKGVTPECFYRGSSSEPAWIPA